MNIIKTDILALITEKQQRIIFILFGNILMILSAYISFYLPGSPVPVTFQTLIILLWSVLFGMKAGFISVFLYVMEGMLGLPVFSNGRFGILALMGPTGGYIIGFLVASLIISILSECRQKQNLLSDFCLMILGSIIIYLFGVSHLTTFFTHSINVSIKIGLIPFVVGDLYKIVVAVLLLRLLKKG